MLKYVNVKVFLGLSPSVQEGAGEGCSWRHLRGLCQTPDGTRAGIAPHSFTQPPTTTGVIYSGSPPPFHTATHHQATTIGFIHYEVTS